MTDDERYILRSQFYSEELLDKMLKFLNMKLRVLPAYGGGHCFQLKSLSDDSLEVLGKEEATGALHTFSNCKEEVFDRICLDFEEFIRIDLAHRIYGNNIANPFYKNSQEEIELKLALLG